MVYLRPEIDAKADVKVTKSELYKFLSLSIKRQTYASIVYALALLDKERY